MRRINEAMNIDATDVEAQIDLLRKQLDDLMRERIRPAVTDVADIAAAALQDVGDAGRHQVAALSRRVRGRPVTAVLVAVGAGYLLARLLR
jgi:hypothetical protein